MKFSERIGLTPIKIELQTDNISDALRVKIWNIITVTILENLSYDIEKSGSLYTLIRVTWHSFLKMAFDIMPTDKYSLRNFLKKWFMSCEWYDVYNFLEFLIKNYPFNTEKFKELLNTNLEEEISGFRIIGDEVSQITDKSEIKEIEEALIRSRENKIMTVNKHIKSAISKFSDKKNPDFRNSIKESISAVESLSKIIVGKPKAELGEALKIIEKNIDIHGALKKGFLAIYGYTSDAGGIRHCMIDESYTVNFEDAKYMLISCSAFINYLIVKADKSGIKFN